MLAKDAYEGLNLGLTSSPSDSRINPVRLKGIKFEDLGDFLFNSLEAPVERKFKAISDMKSAIRKAGLQFSMMRQKQPDYYVMRLKAVAGDLSASEKVQGSGGAVSGGRASYRQGALPEPARSGDACCPAYPGRGS